MAALGGAPRGKGMNPSMLPAFFSSSWDAFVLGRAGWIFFWANGFALPYLSPSLVADDNMLGIVAEWLNSTVVLCLWWIQ